MSRFSSFAIPDTQPCFPNHPWPSSLNHSSGHSLFFPVPRSFLHLQSCNSLFHLLGFSHWFGSLFCPSSLKIYAVLLPHTPNHPSPALPKCPEPSLPRGEGQALLPPCALLERIHLLVPSTSRWARTPSVQLVREKPWTRREAGESCTSEGARAKSAHTVPFYEWLDRPCCPCWASWLPNSHRCPL